MRAAAVSSYGASLRMWLPLPIGGPLRKLGSQLRSLYRGLESLGVPEQSLQSFPEAFRVGMAARADILLDQGENDPKNWDEPFGSGQIHIAITVFSDSEEKWRHTMALARQQYHGFSGVTVLHTQDFGAQPGDRNPLGFKDSIGQPAIAGSGVDPLPGQGRPISAGNSSSVIRARPVCQL